MIGRRLDIQGLRAIAVLAVLFYHAFPAGPLKGGFIGVDVFFVISGFLITHVISSGSRDGIFSILDFYRRRARRLLPALFAVIVSTLFAGYFLFSPNSYLQLAKSVIPALAFVSNFYFSNNVDYFDADAEIQPLLHTWSLSVEEQFYLGYPLLLIALLKMDERSRPVWMIVLTLSALVLSEALVRHDPSWSYYASPARAFELFVGCSAALLSSRFTLSSLQANMISMAGAALIVISFLAIDSETQFPGLVAAIPCLGTAAILVSGADRRPFVSRLISNPLFAAVGNVSYSMYLWHWPILAFARALYGLNLPPGVAWAAVLATAALSYISFRWIEQPFLKREANSMPIFRLAAASFAAIAIFAIAVRQGEGMPGRFSTETNALFAASNDISPQRKRCHASSRRPLQQEDNCVFGSSPPEIVVWGDSHGVELAYALGERSNDLGHGVLQITLSACPPILGYEQPGRPLCRRHNAATLTQIIAADNLRTVVLSAFLQNPRYGDGATLLEGYEETVRSLAAAGKTVVMIVPVPTYDVDIPERLGIYHAMGIPPRSLGMPRGVFEETVSPIRRFMIGLAGKYPAALVFDPTGVLCDESMCHAYDERIGSRYFNKDHISLAAARVLAGQLEPMIKTADSE